MAEPKRKNLYKEAIRRRVCILLIRQTVSTTAKVWVLIRGLRYSLFLPANGTISDGSAFVFCTWVKSRCRLFLSLRSRILKASDCSPANRERELGKLHFLRKKCSSRCVLILKINSPTVKDVCFGSFCTLLLWRHIMESLAKLRCGRDRQIVRGSP